jgi:hypothetical protein
MTGMPAMIMFRNRCAATVENAYLRVTVLEEGGHIAEVFDKKTGVNPLWLPSWPSIEPSAYDPARHPEYGAGPDARLLAGIMGHNLCLDIFGGPSAEEAAAGLTAHGEAPVTRYEIDARTTELTMRGVLAIAQLKVERCIELHDGAVRICESVENLSGCDRPVGWTQHVTLGPPFLQKGATQFRASATQSKVFEARFGPADYLKPDAVFGWPMAPRSDGGLADLQMYTDAAASSAYTAHLMDPRRKDAYFVAFTPAFGLAFGYVWRRADFPWMGIWEENRSRLGTPWKGTTLTRGMEFGVSPIPESRRQMIDRGRLFDVPTYRWIPARTQLDVEYWVLTQNASEIPDSLEWPAGTL